MRSREARLKVRGWAAGIFAALSHYSLSHPGRVMLLAAALMLGVAPGIWRLKVRTDGRALISPDAPEFLEDQDIRSRFGIGDQIVVLIRCRHPDGIFNPGSLQLVRDLT